MSTISYDQKSASHSGDRLYLMDTANKGIGVFTSRQFELGEELLRFAGNIVDLDSVEDHGRYLQVDKFLFLGSSGQLDDFINHSCDPNCGVRRENNEIVLTAIRKIGIGNELTFDYSTWMAGDLWEMECLCESAQCRGRIRDFKYLPPTLKRIYIENGIVPDFVLDEYVT